MYEAARRWRCTNALYKRAGRVRWWCRLPQAGCFRCERVARVCDKRRLLGRAPSYKPHSASRPNTQVELRPGDLSWPDFLASVPQPTSLQAHVADSDDTATILFSSGTTGGSVTGLAAVCGKRGGSARAATAGGSPASNPGPALPSAALQASPRPCPGAMSRRCAAPPTRTSTRTCGGATGCAGPPAWAGCWGHGWSLQVSDSGSALLCCRRDTSLPPCRCSLPACAGKCPLLLSSSPASAFPPCPAALLNGATIALLHGSPQGRPFGQFVEAAGVTMLGVVPSIVKVRWAGAGSGRISACAGPGSGCATLLCGDLPLPCAPHVQAWRASDCMRGLDWSSIRCFRCNRWGGCWKALSTVSTCRRASVRQCGAPASCTAPSSTCTAACSSACAARLARPLHRTMRCG